MIELLFVPVVDGFDVAEDDLVFAVSEIVGNGQQTDGVAEVIGSVDAQTHQRHVAVDDLPQVAHVVALRFHQFLHRLTHELINEKLMIVR